MGCPIQRERFRSNERIEYRSSSSVGLPPLTCPLRHVSTCLDKPVRAEQRNTKGEQKPHRKGYRLDVSRNQSGGLERVIVPA